jgi:hypothetical protein
VSHPNALLTPRGGCSSRNVVVDQHWSLRRAAERFQVSVPTAARWAKRYREHGRSVEALIAPTFRRWSRRRTPGWGTIWLFTAGHSVPQGKVETSIMAITTICSKPVADRGEPRRWRRIHVIYIVSPRTHLGIVHSKRAKTHRQRTVVCP